MMALKIWNTSRCSALALMDINVISLPESNAILRPLGYVDVANEFLLQLLLYGNKDFPVSVNRHILELTLNFIHKTGRFD